MTNPQLPQHASPEETVYEIVDANGNTTTIHQSTTSTFVGMLNADMAAASIARSQADASIAESDARRAESIYAKPAEAKRETSIAESRKNTVLGVCGIGGVALTVGVVTFVPGVNVTVAFAAIVAFAGIAGFPLVGEQVRKIIDSVKEPRPPSDPTAHPRERDEAPADDSQER